MPGTILARTAARTTTTRRGPFRAASLAAALALCALGVAGCSDDDDDDDAVPDTAVGGPLDPLAPVDGAGVVPDVGSDIDVDPIDGGADDLPVDDDPLARPFGPVDVPGDARRNLAGLYDASIRRPRGLDVRYVLIDLGGALVVYDYDQDPYGTGLNCYRAGVPQRLVRDRGDDYLLDGRSVRIARETLGIGFGYTDTLDDDRDGDFTDFVYYRYPLLSGLSALDLNLCR